MSKKTNRKKGARGMSNPGFFFYSGDWLKDTRCLSAPTKGYWIDALCFLNEHQGSITWPMSAFANFWGITTEAAAAVLEELSFTKTAEVEWNPVDKSVDKPVDKSAKAGAGRPNQNLRLANDRKAIAKLSCRCMVRRAEKDVEISEFRSEAGQEGNRKRWGDSSQKSQPSSSSSISSSHNLLRGAAKAKVSDSEPLTLEQIERNKKFMHDFTINAGKKWTEWRDA